MKQEYSLAHLTVLGCPPPEMTYIAARAGYDPRAAVSLWQKMGKLGGSAPPEWLSTHPSNETRLKDLEVYAQKVMPLYQSAAR